MPSASPKLSAMAHGAAETTLMSKSLILALSVVMLLAFAVSAQETRPALKPNVSPAATETIPALLMEIKYNPTLPPNFLDVRGVNEKPTWMWMTRFMNIPGWEKPAGELPIWAVRVEPQFNGETVDVRVSVLKGRGTEREDLVGKYQLGIGEPRTIQKLESFGIQPFELLVKRANLPLPPPPAIDLRVSSIEVLRVDREAAPMPAYWIKVRNSGTKRIDVLTIKVVNGASAMLQGEEGRGLIEPGQTYERYVPVAKPVQDGAGYVPAVTDAITIMIETVVYSDGTFEGDKSVACNFESFSNGRRYFLTQVIPVLEAATGLSPSAVKEKLNAMVFSSASEFTSKCKSNWSAEVSAKSMRAELLRELEKIITTRPKPPVDFEVWLKSTTTRYSEWLARYEEIKR